MELARETAALGAWAAECQTTQKAMENGSLFFGVS